MNLKKWIEENKNSTLTEEDIKNNIEQLEIKYNVNIPNDLKEFWLILNGYVFQGCDMIASLTETEQFGISSVKEITNEFKEYTEDWEIDYEIPNFIVVGTIYEHGYVIYLNNIKKYTLIEDEFDDFVLDGNDSNLLQFNTIYDVFVYFDYNVGNKIFEEEYKKLFPEEVRKEEEYFERMKKLHLDNINKLENEVRENKAISFDIAVDDNYIDAIKKEYKDHFFSSIFLDKYDNDKRFKIYINMSTKELGILYNDKLETHNKTANFGSKPPIITSIVEKASYFVLKTDRDYLEPILIFKNKIDKDETKALRKLFKKSIFDFF